MIFRVAPPKNVTDLFGNWLKGIPKKDLIQIRVVVCVVIWALWNNAKMTLCLRNREKNFVVGYSYGYPLDPYVVLSLTRGAAGGDEFWVQPFGDGNSEFIHPVRLAIA
jgi:hypothetical protein